VIRQIDVWRVANLTLKRCSDEAMVESTRRVGELAADCDDSGVAVWRGIVDAIGQLVNTTPPGPVY
jgi:hypothetical protein